MANALGIVAVNDVVSLFVTQWNQTNTDNVTPKRIVSSLDVPWEDIDQSPASDTIYVKLDIETVETSIYAINFWHTIAITVEVIAPKLNNLTYKASPHFNKLVQEVTRIVAANPRDPTYGYLIYKGVTTRYNKDKGVYLGSVDVEMLKVE